MPLNGILKLTGASLFSSFFPQLDIHYLSPLPLLLTSTDYTDMVYPIKDATQDGGMQLDQQDTSTHFTEEQTPFSPSATHQSQTPFPDEELDSNDPFGTQYQITEDPVESRELPTTTRATELNMGTQERLSQLFHEYRRAHEAQLPELEQQLQDCMRSRLLNTDDGSLTDTNQRGWGNEMNPDDVQTTATLGPTDRGTAGQGFQTDVPARHTRGSRFKWQRIISCGSAENLLVFSSVAFALGASSIIFAIANWDSCKNDVTTAFRAGRAAGLKDCETRGGPPLW